MLVDLVLFEELLVEGGVLTLLPVGQNLLALQWIALQLTSVLLGVSRLVRLVNPRSLAALVGTLVDLCVRVVLDHVLLALTLVEEAFSAHPAHARSIPGGVEILMGKQGLCACKLRCTDVAVVGLPVVVGGVLVQLRS